MVATATISAAEQYMLELVNRARLDPTAEAARLGISLNAGLAAGAITTTAKQVLAHNGLLETAAINHAQWMLAADVFSHTGSGGSTPGQRVSATGYSWSTTGENISWQGSTAAISLNKMISVQHDALFKSAPHRTNLMRDQFKEVGLAQEQGLFRYGATNFNASMVGQSFGTSGQSVFVTGVAFTDTGLDRFYTIGEGRAGLTLVAADGPAGGEAAVLDTATTGAAGGYALALAGPMASVHVQGLVGETEVFKAILNADSGNIKLDVVDGKTLYSSGDIELVSGINNLRLLGVSALDATGNTAANNMAGNKGANIMQGGDGNDTVTGDAGNDSIFGGMGADSLYGQVGNDVVYGGDGVDYLSGGGGVDQLLGGTGNDLLRGGTGIDSFVFANGGGADRIIDFDRAAREKLVFDDELWGGATLTNTQIVAQHARVVGGVVVFNFGDGDTVTLTGITSVTGLSALIEII